MNTIIHSNWKRRRESLFDDQLKRRSKRNNNWQMKRDTIYKCSNLQLLNRCNKNILKGLIYLLTTRRSNNSNKNKIKREKEITNKILINYNISSLQNKSNICKIYRARVNSQKKSKCNLWCKIWLQNRFNNYSINKC